MYFLFIPVLLSASGFIPKIGSYANSVSLRTSAAVDFGNQASMVFNAEDTFTACFWFKAPLKTITNCNVVGQALGSGTFRGWRMRIADTLFTFDHFSTFPSAYDRVTGTLPNITDGNWHHVCGSKDGDSVTDMEIWHNGSDIVETDANDTLDTGESTNDAGANFAIGALDATGQNCHIDTIYIDDVQIYSSQLSSDDISNIYNNGRGGLRVLSDLLFWARIGDEGDTASGGVIDSTANISNGSYAGADADFRADIQPNGFSPGDFAPSFFLEADDLNGNRDGNAGYADGNDVSTWISIYGLKVTALHDDAPIIKNNIKNSLPIVRFDGVDDCLELSDADDLSMSPSGLSIITVVDMQNLSGNSTLRGFSPWGKDDDHLEVGSCSTDCEREYGLLNGNANQMNFYIKCDLNAEPDPQIRNLAGSLSTGWRIWMNSHDGSSDHTKIGFWENGTAIGGTSDPGSNCSGTQLNGTWQFQIGCRNRTQKDPGSGESWADIDLAGLVMYNFELNTNQRLHIEDYFNDKYAIY